MISKAASFHLIANYNSIIQPFKRASCFPGLRKIWIDVRSFFRSKCVKEPVPEPEAPVDIDALVRQHKEEESEKAKVLGFISYYFGNDFKSNT